MTKRQPASQHKQRRGVATFARLVLVESDDCVLWPHHLVKGYGYIRDNQGVHVLACEHHHGPKPTPRHEVAHSCRHRHCMNYRHVRWATRQENNLDKLRDGTHNRGERQYSHKLTEEQVRELRLLWKPYVRGSTLRNLAARFGVSETTVNDCVHGRTWGWLE